MKNKIIKLIFIIVLLIVLIDQLSKIVIVNLINKPVGNEYFGIEIVKNTGMAFGFNSGNIKNIFVTVIILVIIFNFIKNQIAQIDIKTSIAISIVLGGALSNLIDRIFRAGVLDFIRIYKFPIFNLADMSIVIGWILIVVFLIYYTMKK